MLTIGYLRAQNPRICIRSAMPGNAVPGRTNRRSACKGSHYSTFSLYASEELRASIATFLARLPSPEVCWVDQHLLVVAGASRRDQGEPDRLARRARQATRIGPSRSALRAGEAPSSPPDGRADRLPVHRA